MQTPRDRIGSRLVTGLLAVTALGGLSPAAAAAGGPQALEIGRVRVEVVPEVDVRVLAPRAPAPVRVRIDVQREALARVRAALRTQRRDLEALRADWLHDPDPVARACGPAAVVTEWLPKLGVLVGTLAKLGAGLLLTGLELLGLA